LPAQLEVRRCIGFKFRQDAMNPLDMHMLYVYVMEIHACYNRLHKI